VRVFLVTSGVILLSLSLWLAFARRLEPQPPWIEFVDMSYPAQYCRYSSESLLDCQTLGNRLIRGRLSLDGRYRLRPVPINESGSRLMHWLLSPSMDWETATLINLENFEYIADISLMPDNHSVAVAGYDQDTDELGVYRVVLESLEIQRLIHREIEADKIEISPDGGWLATFYINNSVWMLSIFDLETDQEYPILVNNALGGLRWSPDGQQLLFESPSPDLEQYPEIDLEKYFNGANHDLYVVDVASVIRGEPHITQITRPGQGMQAVHANHGAAWSPDGRRIAFMQTALEDGRWGIYQMRADGTEIEHIYEPNVLAEQLQWFPIVDLPYRFWLSFLPSLLLVFFGWRWRA
jgi:hypothetical protein